ncbi:MAG: DNA gyrase subunit A, partial [Thermoleophilia bacterium]|nr:DNA gyrase subunit A [Thermoleophilia bacterium]
YDDRRSEPLVLPSRIPNLLVNGSSGIAVGMATNIPPHNLGEVIDAVVAQIDDPAIEVEGLMRHIKAPDFPTAGIIVGRAGVVDAYRTGRGRIVVRGRAHNEPLKHGRNAIVFTELPYQVNKAELIRKMADLANDKVIPEISDLRDESGRDGVRVVIELRRDAVPMVVLNKLYKHTATQTTFGVNAIALVDGVPRTLGLKDLIRHYIAHQKEVVTRRSRFRLARAEARAHILEGLLKALEHLDEVIALIRGAADPETARNGLMTRFDLTEIQARAILDLRLQRLTQLEAGKIQAEYKELQGRIAELRAILGDERRVYALIREELLEIRGRYADERRTEIVPGEGDIDLEDLIAEEEMVISISNAGYVKRLPVTTYRAQGRGGKGLRGVRLKDDDYIQHLFIASTHHYLLFFTNFGKVYRQKVHELPQGSRDSRGRHIANVLALREGEEVRAVFATRDYSEGKYLALATRDGMVKKTEMRAYDTVLRELGLIAIQLTEGDELVGVQLTDGDEDLLFVSARGQAARFHESNARPMGRDTRGVRAMNLDPGDRVLAMCVARDDEDLLVVTGNGYGKRTPMGDYPVKGRPTKGVRTIKVSDRKGELVTARPVREGDELLLISLGGQVIRIKADSVRRTGRSTEGVRIMNMSDEDLVCGVASVVEGTEDENGLDDPDGAEGVATDEAPEAGAGADE